MKRLIVIAFLIVTPAIMFSQSSKIKNCFKKYKDVNGFELIITDSDIDFDLDETMDFTSFLNNISGIYIMNIDPAQDTQGETEKFFSKIDKLADKGDFKSMIDIGSDDSFSLKIKRDKSDNPSQLLITVTGDDEQLCIYVF